MTTPLPREWYDIHEQDQLQADVRNRMAKIRRRAVLAVNVISIAGSMWPLYMLTDPHLAIGERASWAISLLFIAVCWVGMHLALCRTITSIQMGS